MISESWRPTEGRREGGWDMRVVFIERRRSWWWNAWRPATSTELYGFADTPADAWAAMDSAISAAQVPDQVAQRRTAGPPCSGAA
jgi:hypothetical protein